MRPGTSIRIKPTPSGYGATVVTASGSYEGGRLGFRAVPEYRLAFRVYRQTMYWFRPRGQIQAFPPDQFSSFIWHFATSNEYRTCVFPAIDSIDDGIKIATENFTVETTRQTAW
ncbi:MAG: hypothetical protein ACR2NN_26195 [Bryobacteraceae bacterium]